MQSDIYLMSGPCVNKEYTPQVKKLGVDYTNHNRVGQMTFSVELT